MRPKWFVILVTIAVFTIVHTPRAQADALFDVKLVTSSFDGPLSLFFQLTDGGNAVQNTVTLSDFSLGGGALSGLPMFEGGTTGDFSNQVLLSDTSFLNYALQGFSPGTELSFRLAMTTLYEPGTTPDAFAFSLLGADGFPIPTADELASTFLTIDITSNSPQISNYGVDVSPAPVPEPGTLLLLGTGLAVMAGRRRVRRNRLAR